MILPSARALFYFNYKQVSFHRMRTPGYYIRVRPDCYKRLAVRLLPGTDLNCAAYQRANKRRKASASLVWHMPMYHL